jgi:hypothetical protein
MNTARIASTRQNRVIRITHLFDSNLCIASFSLVIFSPLCVAYVQMCKCANVQINDRCKAVLKHSQIRTLANLQIKLFYSSHHGSALMFPAVHIYIASGGNAS